MASTVLFYVMLGILLVTFVVIGWIAYRLHWIRSMRDRVAYYHPSMIHDTNAKMFRQHKDHDNTTW